MRTIFSFEEIFKEAIIGYAGDCFFAVDEFNTQKSFNFIKGPASQLPREYKHPLFKLGVDSCATYLIHEVVSSCIYVGSSARVYKRVSKHKQMINVLTHDNREFKNLLNSGNRVEFWITVFFTGTREEAYDQEQKLLNDFKNGKYGTVKVLNTANDVRHAMLGHKQTDEHKEKIRLANTGRKFPESFGRKISEARKNSDVAKAQFQKLIDGRKRAISVNGTEYISLFHAARETGIPEIQIRRRVNRGDPFIKWVGVNISPLKGRKLTPEQIQKYKDNTYNAEKTRRLIEQNKKGRRPLVINGEHYNSRTETRILLKGKISQRLIEHHLKNHRVVVNGIDHLTIPVTL